MGLTPSRVLILTLCLALPASGCAARAPDVDVQRQAALPRAPLSAADDALLEDLSKRSFMFFWEQAEPTTGIVRDRSRTDGAPVDGTAREVGSIAAVGFGLAGLCIAAERGWVPRPAAIERTRVTLRFFAERSQHQRGWFYHFINIRTGAREWASELSSIDTALLLAGVLTVAPVLRRGRGDSTARRRNLPARRFHLDARWRSVAAVPRLEARVRLPEVALGPLLRAHGPVPAGHRIADASYSCRCLACLASPRGYVRALLATSAGRRRSSCISTRMRGSISAAVASVSRPTPTGGRTRSIATRAHKAFMLGLAKEFPGYTDAVWGVTASDSRKGYVAWGGPPRDPGIDGTVVPCAAAGSLMLAPEITVPAVREMRQRFGDRIYGRYGFADAFHPTDGWVNPDVIGIDLGITLLSAENLRTGQVWTWFMRNREIPIAMDRVGLLPAANPAQ